MSSLAKQMSDEGVRCRQMANMALGIVMKRLETEAAGGVISIDQMRSVANNLASDNALLAACCGKMERDCLAELTALRHESQRRNYLGRAIVKPLAGLLGTGVGRIERSHLPQFFVAVRMMLGNEPFSLLAARCDKAAGRYRDRTGTVNWPRFYEDPDVQAVSEAVMVAIAKAFQRFEVRQEWMLTVMNSATKAGVKFGLEQNYLVLTALFAAEWVGPFYGGKKAEFIAKWGEPPEKIFGPLLVGLKALGVRLEG